jgi:hypothetical protein
MRSNSFPYASAKAIQRAPPLGNVAQSGRIDLDEAFNVEIEVGARRQPSLPLA